MKINKQDNLLIISKEYNQKTLKDLMYLNLTDKNIKVIQEYLDKNKYVKLEVLINSKNYREYKVNTIKKLGVKSKDIRPECVIYKVKMSDTCIRR